MGIPFENCNFKIPVMLFLSFHVSSVWSGRKGKESGLIKSTVRPTILNRCWKKSFVKKHEQILLYLLYFYIQNRILYSKTRGLSIITGIVYPYRSIIRLRYFSRTIRSALLLPTVKVLLLSCFHTFEELLLTTL